MKAICECLLYVFLNWLLPVLVFGAFMFVVGFAYSEHCRKVKGVVREEPMVLKFEQLYPYRFKDGGRGWCFQYPVPQGLLSWEKRFFIPGELQDRIGVADWSLRDLDDAEWTPDKVYEGHGAFNEYMCDDQKAYITCRHTPKDRRFVVVLLFKDSKP